MKKNYFLSTRVVFTALLLVLSFSNSFAQITETYSNRGIYTFTVPASVFSLSVQAWGAGSSGTKDTNRGGGGGAYAGVNSIKVQPGEVYTIVVGAGAAAGTGGLGGDSSFGSLVIAKGANGASGGKATESTGVTKYSGGNGGSSTNATSGGAGGGGSAGSSGNGKHGSNPNGFFGSQGGQGGQGGAGGGGDGGKGGDYTESAENGRNPGGGGGERGDRFLFENIRDGAGGDGQVIVTYKPTPYAAKFISADVGASTWCAGETRNVSVTIMNVGTQPWTDGSGKNFNIGAKWDMDGSSWTDYHVRVDAQNLQPGETKTYTLSVKASNHDGKQYTSGLAVGKNNLTFDVVLEGTAWFGNNPGDNTGVGPGNSKYTTPNQTITVPDAVMTSQSTNSQTGCVGAAFTPITVTATGTSLIYQWFSNTTGSNTGGTLLGSSNGAQTSSYTPQSNTAGTLYYYCVVSGTCGSSVTSAVSGAFITSPNVSAGMVSFVSNSICIGSTTTVTSNGTSGGTWSSSDPSVVTVNSSTGVVTGVAAGSATITYTLASGCGSPKTSSASISVSPTLTSSVSVVASETTICEGTSVTFKATPINGGSTPIYQWKVNGNPIGNNSAVFTSTVLKDGDKVSVVLTSNTSPCAMGSPATSETITIRVSPKIISSVSAVASTQTVCAGSKVTFTAAVTNGGAAPSYQWFINNVMVSGATAATFETDVLKNGDRIKVELTPSAQPCGSVTKVSSEDILMSEKTSVYKNGSWSVGAPSSSNHLSAEIRENYSTNSGAITACSVHLMETAEVIVVPGKPLIIYNDLHLDTSTKLTVQSDANLIQINDLAKPNKGEINVLRDIQLSKLRQQFNYLGSPVTFAGNQNLKTIYKGITSALYYNESNNYFYNSNGLIVPGQGLAMKEPGLSAYDNSTTKITAEYNGVPQNGVISYALANSNTNTVTNLGYNLVGNPYPSDIDLNKLYLLNGGMKAPNSPDRIISSSFYLWDNTVNTEISQQGSNYSGQAYAMFNAAAGSRGTGTAATGKLREENGVVLKKTPTPIVTIGQGFIVRALQKNQSLIFNNSVRTDVDNPVVFLGKNSYKEDDRFWLTLLAPSGIRSNSAIVYFDRGHPEVSVEDTESRGGSDEIFTIAGGKNLNINGREKFSEDDVLNIGTRHFSSGLYTIILDRKEGVFNEGQRIYLKDKQTNTISDLSKGDYSFYANAGESYDRFEILYVPKTALATDSIERVSVIIYRSGKDFVVESKGEKIESIEIFDAGGRLLIKSKVNAGSCKFSMNESNRGLYIVKVNKKSSSTVKKILN